MIRKTVLVTVAAPGPIFTRRLEISELYTDGKLVIYTTMFFLDCLLSRVWVVKLDECESSSLLKCLKAQSDGTSQERGLELAWLDHFGAHQSTVALEETSDVGFLPIGRESAHKKRQGV